MRTLEDAVEEAAVAEEARTLDDGDDHDDPAPVLPAPLAPRLGLSAEDAENGDFETYNRAVKRKTPRTYLSVGVFGGGGGCGT